MELTNTNATVGNYSRIFFNDTVGGAVSAIIGAKTVDHDNNYGDLEFWTRGAADAATRMVIADSGRVTVKKSSNSEVAALTDAADLGTIAVDFDLANNFSLTIDGTEATRELGNPSNLTAGQSGCIVITQDSTGGGLLTYGDQWQFEGSDARVLSTAADAVDNLVYYVANDGSGTEAIHAVLLKNFLTT